MRRAGNSQLQRGYLPPEPSFFRTAYIILVATAVGATASGGVVLSLVDRSTDRTSVAPGALAQSTQFAPTPVVRPQSAQANPLATNQTRSAKASEANGEHATAWAEGDAVPEDGRAQAAVAPAFTAGRWPVPDLPAQAKAIKKHPSTPRYTWHRGIFALSSGDHHRAWGFSGG